MVVDLMHLVVVVAGIAIGCWALVALRRALPRGRFLVFTAASGGALFGCAAVGGDVGLVSPITWFVLVMGVMTLVAAGGYASGRLSSEWR